MKSLYQTAQLGPLSLKNRIVMAPMTRSRAPGNLPNDLMAKYYSERASAGLILTEGTSPSPNGLGYPRIPGLFNSAQVEGWKKVTDAVHRQGGHIFVQLMHTGRVSHPLNLPPGARILAPSAVPLSGTMWTDAQGMQPYPLAAEMSETEILQAQQEYVTSAELAIQAGFDGVELHGANGYLLEQFLNPNVNHRTDSFGGTVEGRLKFVLDVSDQIAKKIGAERLGIRLSPYGVFNDTGPFPGIDDFYVELVRRLSALKLVYVHLVDHTSMGAPPLGTEIKRLLRSNFKGNFILSGGYDAARAEKDLSDDKGDLVAFGRPFIANPNLVEQLQRHQALKEPNPETFYSPGPKGYTDL